MTSSSHLSWRCRWHYPSPLPRQLSPLQESSARRGPALRCGPANGVFLLKIGHFVNVVNGCAKPSAFTARASFMEFATGPTELHLDQVWLGRIGARIPLYFILVSSWLSDQSPPNHSLRKYFVDRTASLVQAMSLTGCGKKYVPEMRARNAEATDSKATRKTTMASL